VPEFYNEIVGVMKDFNYNSLHDEVKPFMLAYSAPQPSMSNLTVATDSRNYQSLLSKIETLWQKDFPAEPFQYKFLDQEGAETIRNRDHIIEDHQSHFTLMAILISCLGYLALRHLAQNKGARK
jgi:putative ABC transport system permease protein